MGFRGKNGKVQSRTADRIPSTLSVSNSIWYLSIAKHFSKTVKTSAKKVEAPRLTPTNAIGFSIFPKTH